MKKFLLFVLFLGLFISCSQESVSESELLLTDSFNSDYMKKEVEELTREEEEFILHYWEEIRSNQGYAIPITEKFIDMVAELESDEQTKAHFVESLNVIKDVMVDVDYDVIEEGYFYQKNFIPCGHRPCLDCCIYRGLQDIGNSGPVNRLTSFLQAAYTFAVIAADCAIGCA